MGNTTTIRITTETHAELQSLARREHTTVADVVARAAAALRQDEFGRDLAEPLTVEEVAWLDADAG
jgi:hypothetical protein